MNRITLALLLLSSALITHTRALTIDKLTEKHTLKVVTSEGFYPKVPVLLRVELWNAQGARERELWDADATLTTDYPVNLSTNKVHLRNGLGTVLLNFDSSATGSGDFQLNVQLGNKQATHHYNALLSTPIIRVGGTLPTGQNNWSGIIRITNDVTVPTGSILTIAPGTIVMLDGVASGTSANDILVNGTINSNGTERQPVTITCISPTLRWGQLRHNDAQPSIYRYTSISRGGRAATEGHTGTSPVLKTSDSKLRFESCNLTDFAEGVRGAPDYGTPGKVMMASDSELVFDNCVLARCRMGPEIEGTALLCTNTWITDMKGPDDSDGFYAHDQAAGEQVLFTGCVVADGDDDGIDTLGSVVNIENCILRDWANRGEDAKAVSIFNGATHIKGSLIVNSTVGVGAKWSSGSTTLITIENSTLTDNLTNVWANKKSNAPGPFIDFRITNSVMWGGQSVVSDFAPTNFTILYSDVSQAWAGTGNINSDPMFADPANRNYRLLPGSPAIDSGAATSPKDPDGSRADMGAFVFIPPPPSLLPPHFAPIDSIVLDVNAYPNRNYVIESSTNLVSWTKLQTYFQTNQVTSTETVSNPAQRAAYYRTRLAP